MELVIHRDKLESSTERERRKKDKEREEWRRKERNVWKRGETRAREWCKRSIKRSNEPQMSVG